MASSSAAAAGTTSSESPKAPTAACARPSSRRGCSGGGGSTWGGDGTAVKATGGLDAIEDLRSSSSGVGRRTDPVPPSIRRSIVILYAGQQLTARRTTSRSHTGAVPMPRLADEPPEDIEAGQDQQQRRTDGDVPEANPAPGSSEPVADHQEGREQDQDVAGQRLERRRPFRVTSEEDYQVDEHVGQ